MKLVKLTTLVFSMLAFAAIFTACEEEQIFNDPVNSDSALELDVDFRASVDPVINPPGYETGNAATECESINSNCGGSYKVEPPVNGTYSDSYAMNGTTFDNEITFTITETNDEGEPIAFSWSTNNYEVCAVIVKASNSASVYYYEDGSCGDSEVFSVPKPNGGYFAISHVTFCWSSAACGEDPDECYEDETAWADGEEYNRGRKGGNWAMYVEYNDLKNPNGDLTVDLIAGKNKDAGTVFFTPNADPAFVDITITLDSDWVFYYNMGGDELDDNVKVQDYDQAPSGNPAPGQFDWKEVALLGSTSHTITVPLNNYYGVHVDVAKVVECE